MQRLKQQIETGKVEKKPACGATSFAGMAIKRGFWFSRAQEQQPPVNLAT